LAQLLTATGRPDAALEILRGRRFQPWEGGEGQVLSAWDEALLALGRAALDLGDAAGAVAHVEQALAPVPGLGEARHLLANCAHLQLLLGDARAAAGDDDGANRAWSAAASSAGDFQGMAPVAFSDMTYYSVLASRRLGDTAREQTLVAGLEDHARELHRTRAAVDYFATSLPTMLLFEDDLDAAQTTTAMLLDAQVLALRGDPEAGRALVDEVLERDPNRLRALGLRRELSITPVGGSSR
ncbi:MAG TPA: hypothetical protein VGK17_21330, partial [Propionicimonas sp.]